MCNSKMSCPLRHYFLLKVVKRKEDFICGVGQIKLGQEVLGEDFLVDSEIREASNLLHSASARTITNAASVTRSTDSAVIQLIQNMHETLIAVLKGQEQILMEIADIKNDLNKRESTEQEDEASIPSIDPIRRPVSNIKDITMRHIHKMISQDLGIEVTKVEKSKLHTCTLLICDQLAALPSVQALGPRPKWGSIPKRDKKMICARHASMLKANGIDFTRCHGNWASIAKVGQLWKDRQKREINNTPSITKYLWICFKPSTSLVTEFNWSFCDLTRQKTEKRELLTESWFLVFT
ncbi:hypothetical protein PHYBLDRAFT_170797 [Phycomyces blakesleeanus NRRL 1555(-)]|uniref:Uncharacterized protein n=1 Tax=Phycomyces blakesleeanus (strain ATCC 8743b / DSM 1359 / FGSC 10004 / NBRC 33097 / NRRL 1555) TaxID=763407 RepID=A0A163A6M2_PHYB8|nr:hypothetical protein PHYBLDRAFT_170797 [Phycomyces blakesleeanus NRRL 1555(-)]OAD71431.1 hypothetical protein PHYBLDRAFT_170797 [Phycomyces blakesleeanus NRRL 1555(-)]|eukprot:XP_018289471.1 hypothetical protein PHYBLDRAFT_170797 [Phycomyces blakesleeanus NRRL 1555(-)]